MKRFFVILILLILVIILPVFADDTGGYGGIEDSFKYTNSVEDAFNGQKPITDEEFQKTIDKIKAKQNKGKNKKIKGSSFDEENNSGYLNETAEKNILLSVPLGLINGDGTEIPTGHYKIVGTKVGNDVYLDFYQSSFKVARVPAIETQNDFKQSAINFVQLLPYNSQRVEVIYGSMDFNAYTFIRIKKEISDQN